MGGINVIQKSENQWHLDAENDTVKTCDPCDYGMALDNSRRPRCRLLMLYSDIMREFLSCFFAREAGLLSL